MKKLLGLLAFVSSMVNAQELDSLAVDTVEKAPPPYYGAVYINLAAQLGPNPPGLNLTSGVGFGIQYEKWTLGFSQYNFEGTVESFVIFPNVFELVYRYAGPSVGFQVYDSDWIGADLLVSYHWGDMIWREQELQEDFLRDEFTLMTIATSIDLNRFRYAKPYFIVGYQKLNDLSLVQTNNADFSGVFFGLGIRLGYFNQ